MLTLLKNRIQKLVEELRSITLWVHNAMHLVPSHINWWLIFTTDNCIEGLLLTTLEDPEWGQIPLINLNKLPIHHATSTTFVIISFPQFTSLIAGQMISCCQSVRSCVTFSGRKQHWHLILQWKYGMLERFWSKNKRESLHFFLL